MHSRHGPKRDNEGKEVRAVCIECGRETTHAVVTSAEYQAQYSERNFSVMFWDEYQVIECKGCQTFSFRHLHSDTEDTYHDEDTDEEELTQSVKLYPPRENPRLPLRDSHLLPFTVGKTYSESLLAFHAGLPVLTSMGVRALVEAICKEKGAKGSNLEGRIDALVPLGAISAQDAEVLHTLRIMGNRAAHEVRPPSSEELSLALDVVEHALEGIYIIPARASGLPKREVGRIPNPAAT